MNVGSPLKYFFYLNVAVVLLLLGYKAYLNYFLPEFKDVHTEQIDLITQRLADKDSFSFAVVGNIRNSVGIFERQILPLLNDSGVDLVISAGNAVSTGGEDKFQALRGTLSHLDMPYLLTFGENEHERFGSYRFYEHFGPHYYSFKAAGTRFIFLDSTGKTTWRGQIRWLRDLLENDTTRHRVVFLGHPLFRGDREILFEDEDDYLHPDAFRTQLLALFREFDVDAVFSANVPTFHEHQENATKFITTGGAGGLMLDTDDSFYHYVLVTVSEAGITTELREIATSQHPLRRALENLWFFVYSLFYVGYLNFILLVSGFTLVAIKLYAEVFRGRDYYPNYDADPTPWLGKPLRVAMFTNNYLPFIGGVPISIERLRRGLEAQGDQVLVVAPRYRTQPMNEPNVMRVPALLRLGANSEFRIANIFLSRIRKRTRAFKPDVIHLHHPFWLGSLGLFMARMMRTPAIYTYHTRLEHYAHFVPLPGVLFRNLISHALIRRFANKCDGVIVPTYSTDEYLRMIGVTSPTFIQPTGIEYDRFQAVDMEKVQALRESLSLGDETIFVSVSRLSREKNIEFMLDAIDELRRYSKQPFRFLIIGDGHDRKRLQKRIEELKLDGIVTLVGAVPSDDMALWYRLGDVFLFASKSETQGMVILEAMAAGLPVVAVRSSGIDDIVRHGHNGFKTPEATRQWRLRVQELLEDTALREELSANALAFAKDYSVEQFAANVKEIYATVLANRTTE